MLQVFLIYKGHGKKPMLNMFLSSSDRRLLLISLFNLGRVDELTVPHLSV